jgi:thiamine pyrophosphokinase
MFEITYLSAFVETGNAISFGLESECDFSLLNGMSILNVKWKLRNFSDFFHSLRSLMDHENIVQCIVQNIRHQIILIVQSKVA